MEAFVLKLKKLSHFSLVLVVALTVLSPSTALAQDDDMPVSDDEIIIPPGSNNTDTPPTIIDESDSESVSDVEEYDG